jgi:hypothetical protein
MTPKPLVVQQSGPDCQITGSDELAQDLDARKALSMKYIWKGCKIRCINLCFSEHYTAALKCVMSMVMDINYFSSYEFNKT